MRSPRHAVGLFVCAAAVSSCRDATRYAIVEVDDPMGIAGGATQLRVGPALEQLAPVPREGKSFPLTLALSSPRDERRPLWVEARDEHGATLGRGRPLPNGEVTFRRGSTTSAHVTLARACSADSDCDRADPCVNVGRCEDSMCVYPAKACDDHNDNPNDGCDVCRLTEWTASVLVGRGEGRGDATQVAFYEPQGVAVDRAGNIFVADTRNHVVRRIDAAAGITTIVAGTGEPGFGGDGGPATSARLRSPGGVAVDGVGNVIIADTENHRVRRVCGSGPGCRPGTIDTLAGNGAAGVYRDGELATNAPMPSPTGVAVDGAGNVYVAVVPSHRVARVCLDGIGCSIGVVSTVAGSGAPGFSGDGAMATQAQLYLPRDVAVDAMRNVYITDMVNKRVRRVCGDETRCAVGTIDTVAGNGSDAPVGYDADATSVALVTPSGLALDRDGNLYISDAARVVRLCLDAGTCTPGQLTHVAGDGQGGFGGDGGPARLARMGAGLGLAVGRGGDLLIADGYNHRVRRVCAGGNDCVAGTISTVAGAGRLPAGMTQSPLRTPLDAPVGLVSDSAGNLLVADAYANRVRRACLSGSGCTEGIVDSIAGTGESGAAGDGGPAWQAQLAQPADVIFDRDGNLLITDTNSSRVRRVCLTSSSCALGTIESVVGTGAIGSTGDGGPASEAALNTPRSLALNAKGDLYISDYGGHRVRRVCGDATACTVGTIATVVGDGVEGYSGDGGPAASARLAFPKGLAFDVRGNLLIADGANRRIRRLCLDASLCTVGTLSTVAGNGTATFAGDGGPATSASLDDPSDVAVDGQGNLYIADASNHRIRRVCGDPARCVPGVISTVLGTGVPGATGDHGLAVLAQVDNPQGLSFDPDGDLLVSDVGASSVRRVCLSGVGCTLGHIETVVGPVDPQGDGLIASSRLGAPFALAGSAPWLVADGASGRIRSFDPTQGELTTVVGVPHGGGTWPAIARFGRLLLDARGLALDAAAGRLFVSEYAGHAIDVVDLNTEPWTIATFAGRLSRSVCCAADEDAACLTEELADPRCADDSPGYTTGAGSAARFANPTGLAFDAARRALLVADAGNHVVRSIDVDSGATSLIAGTPRARGDFGDGVAAAEALLSAPQAVALGNDASLYIADTGNNRVRRVDASGTIEVVLGDGTSASSGEGGPARYFPVDQPLGLAVDSHGNLFVTSSSSLRVVVAGEDGVATGDDETLLVYGRPPRDAFPQATTFCLSGIALLDGADGRPDGRLYVLDACAGYLVELARQVR